MEYNKFIDHTFLKAEGQKADIDKLIEEAIEYNFFSVCIQPCFVEYAKEKLKASDIKIATVIGFPLGANTTETKVFETKDALDKGADEIDMVINVGKLKDKDYAYLLNEIKEIKAQCGDKILKVIIETSLLDKDEIIKISQLIVEAGGDFVKTSTGFSSSGAKVEDVRLIKETVKDQAEIKASGGIRDHETMVSMIEAGATRIGASAGKNLL